MIERGRVAGASSNAEAQQVGQAADVATGGVGFVEDAVFPDGGDRQVGADSQPDPAAVLHDLVPDGQLGDHRVGETVELLGEPAATRPAALGGRNGPEETGELADRHVTTIPRASARTGLVAVVRRRLAVPGDDRGGIAVMLLFIGMVAIVAAAGLLGGGAVFAARSHGYDLAQAAARSGAQQIDTAAYRTDGTLRLDPARAAQAAKQFLAAAGATGSVQVSAAEITVTATSRQTTPMLRMFGISTVTVTSTAAATPTLGPPT
jgi:hypothetical protein